MIRLKVSNCKDKLFYSLTKEELDKQPIQQFGAAVYTNKKFCECPKSENGIINLDTSVHESNCRIRKRLQTKGYVTDTSVVKRSESIDYVLGVVLA